jgi:hypothetical protein
LEGENTKLGFGQIKPTAVLGCVVPFEPFYQPPGFASRESLVK